MAFEPFGLVGGITVGIPPVLVIDSSGNVNSNRANIANISTSSITSTGNITAPFFIGNIVGNVSGNFVVPGTNTSIVFNQEGNAGASDNLQFDYASNVLNLTGNLTVTNILTDNYLYSNGAPYVFAAQAAGTDTQIQFNASGLLDASANLTFNNISETFSTNNISATSLVITNIQSANVTATGNVSVTGNITALNVTANLIGNVSNANTISANFITGVLTTNSQPNITSVGTLSGLTLAGNIIPAASNLYNLGSNVARWNDLYLNGNTIYLGNAIIEANGTSLILTNPDGSNYVFGGNDLSITGDITAGGNLTIGNITAGNSISANYLSGVLTTQSQPNITSVGVLNSLSVAGNINTGNLTAVNRVTANQISGVLLTGSQPNVTSTGVLTSLTVTGNITSTSGVFAGNASGLTQIPAANIVGFIPNANYANTAGTAILAVNSTNANTANLANIANTATTAGTVTTNSQPNITSVGTLSSLSVAGNVTANNFVGNFVGTITNANFASYAGNVTVASQPNITSVGTMTALNVNGNITAANITSNTGVFTGNGSGLRQLTAANIVGTVANATYATIAGSTTNAGTVTTNSQPNITSVGILTSLSVNGNITSGNIIGGNRVSANYFTGVLTTNVQPNITRVGTLSVLSVNGNLTSTNITATGIFSGNGGGLANLSGSNVVGAVANASYATIAESSLTSEVVTTGAQPNITSVGILSSLSVSGNIIGGNRVSANFFTGVLTTQAQPNITSVGTLASLAVSGILTSANITVTTGRFTGNGSGLTNLNGANITGNVSNATYATTAGSSNTAVTVTGNNQPNITTVGTLTSLSVSGNITSGNVTGANSVSANYFTGVLITQAQPNITSVGTLTTLAVSGNIISGNITATTGRFAGNGSGLTNLPGGNVTGTVANASYATNAGTSATAGTVTTGAQPNITSVGVLTGLSSTGNITAPYFIGNIVGNISGNINVPGTNTSVLFNQQGNAGSSDALRFNYSSNVLTATGNIVANYFIGNGSSLSQLTGSNVVGDVANATYATNAGTSTTAGTVTTSSQPNISSVGVLTSLSVSGTINSGNIAAGNRVSANFITGVLTTQAQPNITSTGTLSSLAVSGNVTTGNVTSSGIIAGNGSGLTNLPGGNVVGAVANATYATSSGSSNTAITVTGNNQPNITSVGTLTSLSVTGNVNSGNINSGNLSATGQIEANNLTLLGRIFALGSANVGNLFTTRILATGNVTAPYFFGNLIGNIANSNYALYAGNVVDPLQPNITTVGTLSNLSISGTGSVTGGNLVSANFLTGTLTTQTQPNIRSVGNLSFLNVNTGLPGANGNITFNGSMSGTGTQSNISITGNLIAGNLNATLIAGTLTTNDQPNITSIGNLTSLVVSGSFSTNGTVNLGNVSNVIITGGSANYILSTNGSGNLSWRAETSGNAAGGNTQVQFNDAGSFAGNPSFTYNKTSNTLGVDGRVIATNVVQGTSLISTVSTGTAPFTVTSTTRVANLNVANAGVAGTVTTNVQPNINQLGVLNSLSVAGSANLAGQTFSSNISVTGTITAVRANIGNSGTINATISNSLQLSGGSQLTVLGNINAASSANVFLGNVSNVKITGGTNGFVLQTDGAGNLSWTAQTGNGGGGNGVPGGANTQIQFNDSGSFGGSSFLTFNKVSKVFQIDGNAIANSTQVGTGSYKFSTQYVTLAATTSATANQIIWSTTATNVSGVDFQIIATDATGATRQSTKISSLVYGTNVVWNEYSSLQVNGIIGSFSVDYNAGIVRLLVSPDSSNSTTYKMLVTEYAP